MSNKALGIAAQIMVTAIVVSVILLFAGIGVLILIHVCIIGRAFRSGFGNLNIAERDSSSGTTSMSRDDVEKLPCFHFEAKDVEGSNCSPVDCAVCLESFRVGDKCRLLPLCRHSFHAHCVDSWLMKAAICPICRTGLGKWKAGEGSDRCSGDTYNGSEVRQSQTRQSGHLREIVAET